MNTVNSDTTLFTYLLVGKYAYSDAAMVTMYCHWKKKKNSVTISLFKTFPSIDKRKSYRFGASNDDQTFIWGGKLLLSLSENLKIASHLCEIQGYHSFPQRLISFIRASSPRGSLTVLSRSTCSSILEIEVWNESYHLSLASFPFSSAPFIV